MISLNSEAQNQISECTKLLKNLLKQDILGIYLYGSAIVGGLQKYSDLDLFVVSNRAMTMEEKKLLVKNLLQTSGIYMKSENLPLELTIVVKSEVNPWRYPPTFDFQYGEWLRKEFESGIIEPWSSKLMPDLALLITQVLLASETIYGQRPDQLLCAVPYRDLIQATKANLDNLMAELNTDTRNVLLTCARIWNTLETNNVTNSKPVAALWAMDRLPREYQPVLERARLICIGEVNESWHDMQELLQPCANFMLNQIYKLISSIESSGYTNKSIY